MKYLYDRGIGKQANLKWVIIPVLLATIGLYVGFNVLSPMIFYAIEPTDKTAQILMSEQPTQNVDKLYMPKINATVTIAPTDSNDAIAPLKNGAVSRSIQNGNPKAGGNYVVVAERFSLELLPYETFKRSYFYNLNNLEVGDDIFVDYKGTRFAYKVDAKENKQATDPGIEARSDESKLTLYTAELARNGTRDIYTAELVGQVVWAAGVPRVEPVLD